MPHELRALDAYRLEQDLTFKQLAAEMAAANCPIGYGGVSLLCKGQVTPRERTMYKVRKFLAVLEERRRARVRGRRLPGSPELTDRP